MKTPTCQTILSALAASGLLTVLTACGTAKITGRQFVHPTPPAKPKVVYVADFDLPAAEIKAAKIFLPPLPKPPLLGDILPPLPGAKRDPREVARQVIHEMSETLVQNLRKSGLNARRYSTNAPLPASGWLVRGVFTEVDQGHQLRRAAIGFGSGQTQLQVVVDVSDLRQGAPRKFYELTTQADSGQAPGAGPTLVLGPAGLAARIVMAGGDLDRNVKQTAAKIASEVILRTEQSPGAQQAGL